MKKFNPLVSIIIPVFNGSNYLERAIQSCLNQYYKNIEILVINDGSDDGHATALIAAKYKDNIRYFYKENGGCGSALNLGIKEMRGDYFSWLSHDDLYLPTKIHSQIEVLSGLVNKNTIIYSAFEVMDENENNITYVYPHKTLGPEKINLALVPLLRGLIHGCTLLIPKKLFTEIGTFDLAKKTTQDYALWFDFFRKAPLHYIPHVLVKARIHASQDTQKLSTLHLEECNVLWSGFVNDLNLDEMKALDESKYGFISGMAEYLAITPFKEATHLATTATYQMLSEKKVLIIVIADDDNVAKLTASLNSVSAQFHQNLEIAVIFPDIDPELGSIQPQFSPNIRFHSYKSFDEYSKNEAINSAIESSSSPYIAFLHSGDIYAEDKILKQLQFMLKKDAAVCVTNIDCATSSNEVTTELYPGQFVHHGFPILLFKLNCYQSTLMIRNFPAENPSFHQTIASQTGLPTWLNILTLFETCYLDEKLTNVQEVLPSSLKDLRNYLSNKFSNILLTANINFLLHTNLYHRNSDSDSTISDAYISHHIDAIHEYEKKLLDFWGGEPVDYASLSLRSQLLVMRKTIFYRLFSTNKNIKKDLTQKQAELEKQFIRFKQLSFADYEGFLVRAIKPLIPIFIWKKVTSTYQQLKQLIK